MIVDYELEPKLAHSFYYCNDRTLEHVIYTLSTDSAQTLKDLKIKGYTFDGFGEEQEKTEVSLGKPNVAKKTPNPTVVFTFPNSTCFEIELLNPTKKELKVSMGINHQEVIFLPFNHEYPFQLHKEEYLNILSDVNIPGFIELQVKKCDQSSPMLGYTFDYESFMKGEFLYRGALDELSTNIVIKANRIGTLFLNFQSAEDQTSLITVKLVYSEEKGRHKAATAGKAG